MVRADGGPAQIRHDQLIGRLRADGSQRVGMIRRTAVAGAVDEIDAVAFLRVVMCPAGLTVALTHVMEHLARASMDQNNWIGMPNLSWNQILNVHLAADDGAIRHGL